MIMFLGCLRYHLLRVFNGIIGVITSIERKLAKVRVNRNIIKYLLYVLRILKTFIMLTYLKILPWDLGGFL